MNKVTTLDNILEEIKKLNRRVTRIEDLIVDPNGIRKSPSKLSSPKKKKNRIRLGKPEWRDDGGDSYVSNCGRGGDGHC